VVFSLIKRHTLARETLCFLATCVIEPWRRPSEPAALTGHVPVVRNDFLVVSRSVPIRELFHVRTPILVSNGCTTRSVGFQPATAGPAFVPSQTVQNSGQERNQVPRISLTCIPHRIVGRFPNGSYHIVCRPFNAQQVAHSRPGHVIATSPAAKARYTRCPELLTSPRLTVLRIFPPPQQPSK
jgi:hypothetical protein